MSEAFVIAEVLTSTAYADAAEALVRVAEDYEYDLKCCTSYTAEEASELEEFAARLRETAGRFWNVYHQVREQELRVVGIE